MLVVLHVLIDGTDIVVVDAMFNILHVFVGGGETGLSKMVDEFVLRVLVLVFDAIVDAINNLAEVLLSLFSVNLRELLHLELVLGHKVLFLLSKIS